MAGHASAVAAMRSDWRDAVRVSRRRFHSLFEIPAILAFTVSSIKMSPRADAAAGPVLVAPGKILKTYDARDPTEPGWVRWRIAICRRSGRISRSFSRSECQKSGCKNNEQCEQQCDDSGDHPPLPCGSWRQLIRLVASEGAGFA